MTGIAVGAGFLAGAWLEPRVLAIVAGFIVVRLLCPGRRELLLPAVAVLLAAGLGVARGQHMQAPVPITWVEGTTAIVGKVVSDPIARRSSQSFTVEVTGAARDHEWEAGQGRVCVSAPLSPMVGFGDTLDIMGKPVPAADQSAGVRAMLKARSCGASFYGTWLKIDHSGSGWRRQLGEFRWRLDRVLFNAAPGDAGALLAGLVTGDDGGLSPGRRDAFLVTGTSHITAVSGANLALLITVLAEVGGFLGARRRLAWDLAIALTIIAYAGLVGFQAPVVRAGLVAILALVAARVGRKPDLATLLILVAAIMVAINPGNLDSLSFKLSFVSAFALVLAAPRTRPAGAAGWLGVPLLMTSVATLATMAFLPPQSRGLPLVATPANLLIGGAVELAYPLAWLTALGGLIAPGFASALAVPGEVLCQYIFAVVDHLRPVAELTGATRRGDVIGVAISGALALGLLGIGADGQRFLGQGLANLRARRQQVVLMAVAAAIALATVIGWLVAVS